MGVGDVEGLARVLSYKSNFRWGNKTAIMGEAEYKYRNHYKGDLEL